MKQGKELQFFSLDRLVSAFRSSFKTLVAEIPNSTDN